MFYIGVLLSLLIYPESHQIDGEGLPTHMLKEFAEQKDAEDIDDTIKSNLPSPGDINTYLSINHVSP